MENFINTTTDAIVKYFFEFREVSGNILTPALPVFYVIALVLSGILLWMTIYFIAKSNWISTRIIEKGMDYFGVGDVGRYRQLRAWNNVVKRMQTGDMSNWKLAIMGADHVLDEIMKASGLRAPTADERFQQLGPEFFSNLAELQEAHRIRNRSAQEPDFIISKEDALKVLRVYKKSFQEAGLLD